MWQYQFNDTAKIKVDNISKCITDQLLYELFSHFGPVRDISFGEQKNSSSRIGYVIFSTRLDALYAARVLRHGLRFGDSTITVSLVIDEPDLQGADTKIVVASPLAGSFPLANAATLSMKGCRDMKQAKEVIQAEREDKGNAAVATRSYLAQFNTSNYYTGINPPAKAAINNIILSGPPQGELWGSDDPYHQRNTLDVVKIRVRNLPLDKSELELRIFFSNFIRGLGGKLLNLLKEEQQGCAIITVECDETAKNLCKHNDRIIEFNGVKRKLKIGMLTIDNDTDGGTQCFREDLGGTNIQRLNMNNSRKVSWAEKRRRE